MKITITWEEPNEEKRKEEYSSVEEALIENPYLKSLFEKKPLPNKIKINIDKLPLIIEVIVEE